APPMGVVGLAYARLGAASASFLANVYTTRASAGIGFRRIGAVLWRPLLGAGLMLAILFALPDGMANVYLELASKIAVGALVYTGALFFSWKSCGRPDGIESLVVARLRFLRPAWRP
ncbi:MAG TPA: polysaccharide biosynthesis C-terminal domain-containing protein, partial [Thiobacillaceae bacterium]